MTISSQLYDRALRSFLLKKHKQAAVNCEKALEALAEDDSLHLNVWTLYLNIACTLLSSHSHTLLNLPNTTSVTSSCQSIWQKLVQDNPHQVDPKLISAYLVMVIKLKEYKVARDCAEAWLASLSDDVKGEYEQVIELYVGCILPAVGDYESAHVFLEYNTMLNDMKKKELLSSIEAKQEAVRIERQKKEEEEKEKEKERKRNELEEKERQERELQQQRELQEKELQQQQQQPKEVQQTDKQPQQTNKQPQQQHSVQQPMPKETSLIKRSTHNILQKWKMNQQQTTSGAILLVVVFMLIALLRGQRTRLTAALQTVIRKLWDTVKMGTKVTYM